MSGGARHLAAYALIALILAGIAAGILVSRRLRHRREAVRRKGIGHEL